MGNQPRNSLDGSELQVKLPPFFKRASTKVTIAVGAIACLLVAVSMLLARAETHKGLLDAEEYHLTALGNLLTASVRAPLAFEDNEMVAESVAGIAPSLPGVMQVIVLDKSGAEVFKWEDPEHTDELSADVATKVSDVLGGDGVEVTGQVFVTASRRELHQTLAKQDRLMLIIILVTLLVAGVLSMFLGKYQMGLEARVAARTFEVTKRNREMGMVFANVDQGFIMLNRDAIMAMERSAVVDLWFGSYAEPRSFFDYMEASDSNFAMNFELGWDSLVDGFMPVQLCIEQLPKRIEVAEQVFSVSYSALSPEESDDEDDWDGVLVVIADITEQLAFERTQVEQQELGTALKAIISDRQGFVDFFTDTQDLVDAVTCGGEDDNLSLLKRSIHTIKGNTGIFGFSSISVVCHELENNIEDSQAAPGQLDKDELRTSWSRLSESVSYLLGTDESSSIEISAVDYAHHLAGLAHLSESSLFDAAFTWQLEPIEKPLDRLAKRARQVAIGLGQPDVQFHVHAEPGLLVDSSQWSTFWSELVHVLRNSVDHGIVKDSNTDKEHSMTFSAFTRGEKVVIEVADNGAGINWDAIEKKAKAAKLPTRSREDLSAAIFHEGLSSSDEVTATSGRGVGMAAVQAIVSERGGSITVVSNPGEGTKFQFHFPASHLFGTLYQETIAQAAS